MIPRPAWSESADRAALVVEEGAASACPASWARPAPLSVAASARGAAVARDAEAQEHRGARHSLSRLAIASHDEAVDAHAGSAAPPRVVAARGRIPAGGSSGCSAHTCRELAGLRARSLLPRRMPGGGERASHSSAAASSARALPASASVPSIVALVRLGHRTRRRRDGAFCGSVAPRPAGARLGGCVSPSGLALRAARGPGGDQAAAGAHRRADEGREGRAGGRGLRCRGGLRAAAQERPRLREEEGCRRAAARRSASLRPLAVLCARRRRVAVALPLTTVVVWLDACAAEGLATGGRGVGGRAHRRGPKQRLHPGGELRDRLRGAQREVPEPGAPLRLGWFVVGRWSCLRCPPSFAAGGAHVQPGPQLCRGRVRAHGRARRCAPRRRHAV
eukprot:scaffold1381_cov386-Prasinococcus_capsulatus_cf.AAC.18